MKKLYDNEETKVNVGSIGHVDKVEEEKESVYLEINEEKTEEVLSGLTESAKEIFANDVIEEEVFNKFFTIGKGKSSIDIGGSFLSPASLTTFGGKLETRYGRYIENIVYSRAENISPDQLYPLVLITSYIKEKQYPIQIKDKQWSRVLPSVVNALNEFFNDKSNRYVLLSITNMFEGMMNESEES